MNIISQFEQLAASQPQAPAIMLGDTRVSYEQLNNFANYIATLLLENGISQSAVVAITGSKSIEMIAMTLAILKIRGSYMPLEPHLSKEVLQKIMCKSAVTTLALCTAAGLIIQLSQRKKVFVKYSAAIERVANLGIEINSDDPAYVIHTSGSTGNPKAVVVPHRGIIRLLLNTNYIQITPADKVLFHSNIAFDAGIFEVWAALLSGAALVLYTNLAGDIYTIYKICRQKKITVLLLTTGLFHIFSSLDLQKLSKLQYLVVGGDVMHSAPVKIIMQKNKNLKIINGYGPAENCVFTTCKVIDKDTQIGAVVSIGKPITGTQIYLLDENLQEVSIGAIGEIYTAGSGVALGYLNAVTLSQERFIKLPHIANSALLYKTGDMARRLPASEEYEFIGRCDNEVKIRGFRVELTEVEEAIGGLIGVEDVCVCIVGNINKKIAAFIKLNNLALPSAITKKSIAAYISKKLPAYCLPSYIEISDEFPVTVNGKINRKLIQERLHQQLLAVS